MAKVIKQSSTAKAGSKKDEIISGLIEARRKILDTAASLSPAQQDEVYLGIWSIKDMLAHLVGWDFTNIQAVKEILAGQVPSFYAHYDHDWRTYNASLVAECKRDDFDEIRALVEDSHQRLIVFLRTVPAEEFEKDRGLRFKGWKIASASLLRADIDDEHTHYTQMKEFKDTGKKLDQHPT